MSNWIRALGINTFKKRLLILIIALIGIVQGATILLVLNYVYRDVRHDAEHELRAAHAMLERQLQSRQERLAATAEVLISDYGFKQAVASSDPRTMQSALANLGNRVGADLAILFSADGRLSASTAVLPPALVDSFLRHSLQEANGDAPVAFFTVMNGQPMQFVVAPVRAPEPVAWVAFGFPMQPQAAGLSSLVGLDVEFDTPAAVPVSKQLPLAMPVQLTSKAGQSYLSLSEPLPARAGAIDLVVQRPLEEVMASYHKIRDALLTIGAAALAGAILLAQLIGRSAARPVEALALAAQRIEAGRYDRPVVLGGVREFEHLARSFNSMQISLREREERIRYQAIHDSLTGLLSRVGLRERLHELLAQSEPVTLLLLDLYRFRDINASLDRETADQVLRGVASRLQQMLRPGEHAGRLGADQFALLLRTCDPRASAQTAATIAADLRSGLQLGDLRVTLIVRGGLSTPPAGAHDADDLLRRAGFALLKAKERGLDAVFYDASDDEEHRREVALIAELRRAIANDQLSVAFQPLVRVASGEVAHLEALVRWNHPNLGSVSPAEFSPLAERSAMIGDLTHCVLGSVIEQLCAWRRGGYSARVAVNLSASDVADPTLPQFVLSRLDNAGVVAGQLLFEVTESAILREPDSAVRVMQQLRTAGSRFAIDDFGTGYSSLTQLHLLPVDELKIDRSFVTNLPNDLSNAIIVRSSIAMAHSLGLSVIAEGAEDEVTCAMLADAGCDYIQGYYLSKPKMSSDLLEWLLGGASLEFAPLNSTPRPTVRV